MHVLKIKPYTWLIFFNK